MARPSRHLPLPVFLLFTLPAYAIGGPLLTACAVDKFSSPSNAALMPLPDLAQSASVSPSHSPVNESGGCGYSNSAALRYESCHLRYSNQKFFGIVDRSLAVFAH
ncbi:hypothetical protein HPP92_013666 [Vanilla planifolia]|uniref:Uncharacterized protein n=1 Tax=Vanilla planifolia TaxID=51239 RepID=A0A835R3Y9_VANPL|nr:hypothetical protein HPP92_013666 [Vanilla planifolia]